MPPVPRLCRDRIDVPNRQGAGRSERRKKWPSPPTHRPQHPPPAEGAPPNLCPPSPRALRQSIRPPRRARWRSPGGAGVGLNRLGSSLFGLVDVKAASLVIVAAKRGV